LNEDEQFYGEYRKVLQAAADGFAERLAGCAREYAEQGRRFPVEHQKARIKSAKSAKAKLRRLGLPTTLESAKANLYDLAGVRLVCRFFYEVYEAVRLISGMEGVEAMRIKDYVKAPKPNGYRSVHVLLRVPVSGVGWAAGAAGVAGDGAGGLGGAGAVVGAGGAGNAVDGGAGAAGSVGAADSAGVEACLAHIEVQVRTIAMDFWASLEHELKYKKKVADAQVMSEELKRCADEIISVDLKMQAIYEWLNEPRD
jgi:putative GTP pyrophosphokinase